MKKTTLSFLVLLSFFVYAALLKHHNTEEAGLVIAPAGLSPLPQETAIATDTPQATATATTPATTTKTSNSATPKPTPKPTPTPTPAGKYKNGVYTSVPVDAYYGYVQLKVIISSGKISDVQFLQYPNDRNTSMRINMQAMPYLRAEAIQAQSANVNGVSGATSTSGGFEQALSDALQQAS